MIRKSEQSPIHPFYKRYDSQEKIDNQALLVPEDEQTIDELLSYCKTVFEREEKRTVSLENKVIVLAGFSGSSIAAVLTLFVLFVDSERFAAASREVQTLYIAGAFLALSALLIVIFLCVHALGMRAFHHPRPTRIFDLAFRSVLAVKKKRATEYFYAYLANQTINNRKADNYSTGLKAFQFSLAMTAVLILVVTVQSVSVVTTASMGQTASTLVPTATTTVSTPTALSTQSPIMTPMLLPIP